MATEVNQTYFAWSQEEPTERDGSQGVSVSQMLDHGSISFGRFEFESLSWEKWSVFTHDRRQEELEKFNGLVAEKKAYFEEYYRRMRALKALQQQQQQPQQQQQQQKQQNQQTELTLEYSGDGSDSSQTGEDEPATDFGTHSVKATVVDASMEKTTTETTYEQPLECYKDRENENLNTEFSSGSISSSTGGLEKTEQEIRENDNVDNDAREMNLAQQNANSGHELGTAQRTAKPSKRPSDKDPKLRQSQKIMPSKVTKVNPPSKKPLDHAAVSKGSGSVKPIVSLNQKSKPDNVRSSQKVKAPTQQMVGTTDRNKHMIKEAPGPTGAKRPSSAASRRTVMEKPVDIATPRRPSIAERAVTSCRTVMEKPADIATPRRPSTAERAVTRNVAVKTDPRTPNRIGVSVTYPKDRPTMPGTVKKAVALSAVKSSKPEMKRPSALDSHSTNPRRVELHVVGKAKSSSVNLPPRKKPGSSVGCEQRFLETSTRQRKKEGNKETAQSQAAAPKNIAPLHNGTVKARAPKPPPLPAGGLSRSASKPRNNNTPLNGRKPKTATPHWH